MAHTKLFHFVTLTSAVALLSACELGSDFMDERFERRGGMPVQEGSSEDLLAAEGAWNIVEEDSAIADPSSLHRIAKTRVDPKSMGKKTFIPQSKLALAEANSNEDVNYRLLRVERDVASLRSDFKKLLPPLSNLIVADRQLDKTIGDIQASDTKRRAMVPIPMHSKPSTLKPAAQPMRKPVVTAQQRMAVAQAAAAASPPKAAPAGARAVKSLRLGEHPGRTRVVLDVTGPATFRSDVDNNEKLVLIDLPETGWNAQMKKALKHPLIAGYSAQPSAGGGTVLALEMKKPVKVVGGSSLPPNPTYNNHRIFIDVSAL